MIASIRGNKVISGLCAGLLAAMVLSLGSPAAADCGSIPYYSPLEGYKSLFMIKLPDGRTQIDFDAGKVVVYEPGQRAIILWNGEEETLLLSTDIKTSKPISVLEVIPMPAEPTVRPGNFETFEKMMGLWVDKGMWTVAAGGGQVAGVSRPAAEITFHEQMGAHDISVVKVLDRVAFTGWVDQFLQAKSAVNSSVDPKFLAVIDKYLEQDFQWFVFDSILTADQLQSKQPIEYRFKSPQVFYPLQISSRETGKTTVDLLVVTKTGLTEVPKFRFAVQTDKGVPVTQAELRDVSGDWADFMATDRLQMQRVLLKGALSKMTVDFTAR